MANSSDYPNEQSVSAFLEALNAHDKVVSATRRGDSYLVDVALDSDATLLVLLTDIYVLGEADVREAITKEPKINIVMTLSSWNMTTSEAVGYGRQRRIGVFAWAEFLGAINYRKFWLYEPMPYDLKGDKATRERRRRRVAWN